MDDLQQIILTLTPDERKEFRKFIQRNRFKNQRIDLDLFNLLCQESTQEKGEIFNQLYQHEADRNAYHSVRKRLVKHLNDFIYLNQLGTEETLEAEITKNLILVRHLFRNNLEKLAWKYIRKSENLAEKAELNDQLQLIYELQIEHYDPLWLDCTLKELVKKRRKIAELAQEDQNLKIIGSFVKQELQKVKIKAQDIDLERILDLLLNTFDMKDSLFRRPKLRYNFILIARRIILANKDFYSFEAYLIENYKKISDSGYFDVKPSQRLTILYYIAHTLYRNKKFSEAILYLNQSLPYFEQVERSTHHRFHVKFHLLRAASENLAGNLKESIQILENLNSVKFATHEDELNVKLNLSVYYFQQEEYKKANQLLLKIGRTDNWLEKNMGVEYRIKKSLIELIYQFELQRTELAFDRILSMERIHKTHLEMPKYRRVAVFLALIKTIIHDPEIVQSNQFLQRVESSFDWIDKEKEDLQAMSYYAWLKSKMTNQKFYEVLHEILPKEHQP